MHDDSAELGTQSHAIKWFRDAAYALVALLILAFILAPAVGALLSS